LLANLTGEVRNDFGFETKLATRSYAPLILDDKKKGYSIVLIYFWLESVELAKARVRARVEKGGHNIPPTVIERRYVRGLENFFTLYKNICNGWIVYDNSHEILIARGSSDVDNYVYNHELWKKFKTEK
jgi:predicted ABC-type ATPase